MNAPVMVPIKPVMALKISMNQKRKMVETRILTFMV